MFRIGFGTSILGQTKFKPKDLLAWLFSIWRITIVVALHISYENPLQAMSHFLQTPSISSPSIEVFDGIKAEIEGQGRDCVRRYLRIACWNGVRICSNGKIV